MNEEIEREFGLPFEDVSPNFPIGSSSRAKPFDTSGLQPFPKILASFLASSGPNPPVVNHPIAKIPFQKQPHN